jgi:hypothetical protein
LYAGESREEKLQKSIDFWKYLDSIDGQLLQRGASFKKIFGFLDSIDRPLIIVETGCVRNTSAVAMTGEGQSTLLFDRYLNCRDDGSKGYSVDVDASAVGLSRSLVSGKMQIHQGDSVNYLKTLSGELAADQLQIDLLYLDSYDVDYTYWFASAAHHLKELLAASVAVSSKTLVVIDDCPLSANLVAESDGSLRLDKFFRPVVGGKGRLVAEYAEQIGAKLEFSHYQHGWTGF